jgi:hypothetical protein
LLQVALYLWMTLLPISSARSGQLATALGSWYPGRTDPGHVVIHLHRTRCSALQAASDLKVCLFASHKQSAGTVCVRAQPQVRVANCSRHKRRIYPKHRTGGLCRHVPASPSTLWAFYAVSVRRLAHLLSGFLQTNPRGSAPP